MEPPAPGAAQVFLIHQGHSPAWLLQETAGGAGVHKPRRSLSSWTSCRMWLGKPCLCVCLPARLQGLHRGGGDVPVPMTRPVAPCFPGDSGGTKCWGEHPWDHPRPSAAHPPPPPPSPAAWTIALLCGPHYVCMREGQRQGILHQMAWV